MKIFPNFDHHKSTYILKITPRDLPSHIDFSNPWDFSRQSGTNCFKASHLSLSEPNSAELGLYKLVLTFAISWIFRLCLAKYWLKILVKNHNYPIFSSLTKVLSLQNLILARQSDYIFPYSAKWCPPSSRKYKTKYLLFRFIKILDFLA